MLCHNRQTAVMLCHNIQTHVLVKCLVTFKNMNLDCTAEVKFLGTQITDALKWHCHVQLPAGKLCKVFFIIKFLKKVLSPNLIRNIYLLTYLLTYTMVQSPS